MSSFTGGETKNQNNKTDVATILSWRTTPLVELGTGSFGSVFAGIDNQHRAVAIKLLGEEQRKHAHLYDHMFNTEVRVLSRFHHPNIIQLYHYGKSKDNSHQKALVYERVEADLLQEIQTKGNTFTANERLDIAIDVARGLTFMHGQESVDDIDAISTTNTTSARVNGMAANPCWHRDIKSANIGITKDRCGKLLDCGIAKSRIDVARTMMTVTGVGQVRPGTLHRKWCSRASMGPVQKSIRLGSCCWNCWPPKKQHMKMD